MWQISVHFVSFTKVPVDNDMAAKRVLCVFVPGIKGSRLVCQSCDRRRAWPPAFLDNSTETFLRILSRGTTSVDRLMTESERYCLTHHQKSCDGVLRSTKLFRIFEYDVYDSFLKWLEQTLTRISSETNVDVSLVTYAYDWTKSNTRTAVGLYRFLAENIRNGGADAIILVAHSMGGLVCRYLMEHLLSRPSEELNFDGDGQQTRSDLLKRINLFYGIGVPHYGSVKALHCLVDPRQPSSSESCRFLPSVYEMIPFSDLINHIDGLERWYAKRRRWWSRRRRQVFGRAARNAQNSRRTETECIPLTSYTRRRRSDLFLKCSDGEGITIDPQNALHLRNLEEGTPSNTDDDDGVHNQALLEALMLRFTVLRPEKERLSKALSFHQSLSTEKVPPYCVYHLVNAVGVSSPSGIDASGLLTRDCAEGDGTVCTRPPRRGGGVVSRTAEGGSVHVSMLSHVDLTIPLRQCLLRVSKQSCDDQNDPSAVTTIWNRDGVVRDSVYRRKHGCGCMTTVKPSTTTTTSVISCQHSSIRSTDYKLSLYNTSSGNCILFFTHHAKTVNRRSVPSTDEPARPVSIVVNRIGKRKSDKHGYASRHIIIHTRGIDKHWNTIRVILTGSYEIGSFRQL